MRIKFFDWCAIVFSLLSVAVFSWYAYSGGGREPLVYIQSDSGSFVYPLNVDRDLHIQGPLGVTEIEIKGRVVHVTDSPCRDKVCVLAGELRRKGEWTACLPNRVFVRIEGAEEVEVDATVF